MHETRVLLEVDMYGISMNMSVLLLQGLLSRVLLGIP